MNDIKITDILYDGKVHVSCELFPPKTGDKLANVAEVVKTVAALKPSYMSVTYGATGGTSDYTVDIAQRVRENGIPALAHLTCFSSTKEKVKSVVDQLKAANIRNILCLRGDIPADPNFIPPNEYQHASDLIKDVKSCGDFCIGGACYPEGHPEAPSVAADIDRLAEKIEAGCDFLTTQMFFDNNIYYSFLCKMLARGINVPVVAGIMPITNRSSLDRVVSLSGQIVPQRFKNIAERFGDDPEAMKQAGIAYATDQIIDLIANGVNNVHIYTMNKPDIAAAIMKNLSCIYKPEGRAAL